MRKKKSNFSFRRAALLWLVLFILSFSASAQFTTIGGVVNSYYSVTEVIPAKACVRVSSTTGLENVNKVLLVQMKGASISTTNDNTYGDTSSLNNAGNYEVATICTIIDDSVFFVYNLLNNYTAPADKVQLVAFAEYENALVTSTIKAQPWNNTTGTGGVIAIEVIDTLELNADISADSAGYAGGMYVESDDACSNGLSWYVYNPTLSTQNGAYKGEGVATVTSTQNGGRGAPANGGGGGNNHNNGGGGGANLSAGGISGGNSSNVTFGCNDSYQGLGGKALSNWGGKKIFMGGGAGAGHNNNGYKTTEGGNGGGIIFIHADTIIGNGYKISANGDIGGHSLSDGAGGGGAGGSVILDINTYLGSLTVQATGGNGGNSDDGGNIKRCYGAGGGGSGGVIYVKGSVTPSVTSVAAGAAGVESSRDAGCNPMVPAGAGTVGQLTTNYTYRSSSSFATYCGIALPAGLVNFTATVVSRKTLLKWTVANPGLVDHFVLERKQSNGQWNTLITVTANDLQTDYNTIDQAPQPGVTLYRLGIVETNGSFSYSPNRYIVINDPVFDYSFFPNPARSGITIRSNQAGIKKMRLTDITGKLILDRYINNDPAEIELPALRTGVYLVEINGLVRKLFIAN